MRPKQSGSPRRARDSRPLLDTSRGMLRLSGSRRSRGRKSKGDSTDSFDSLWKRQSWDKLYGASPRNGRSKERRSSRGRNRKSTTKATRFNRLAKHKVVKTRRYTKEDDAKNCTFKPRVRKYRSETKQDEGDLSVEQRLERFMERQDASTRKTRRAVESKRGEEAYKLIHNKKKCRDCGETQSYDAFATKKKFCECGGKFVGAHYGRSGEARREEFVDRLAKRELDRQRRLRELRRRVETEEAGGRRRTTRRGNFHETNFLKRMEKDLKKRETRRREYDAEQTSRETISSTLRTVRNDLRRCTDRLQSATTKSSSARRFGRRNASSDSDARMRKLEQQLRAAALMAQELQEDALVEVGDYDSQMMDPPGRSNRRSGRGYAVKHMGK